MIEPGPARTILILFPLFLFIVGNLEAVTIHANRYPVEEYVLEHRVTYQDAIAEARNLKIYPDPIPGCKECTSAEITYCKNSSVLNDHCCCEGGYNEIFPFVEHTCRLSQQPCAVFAGDCAEYTRLRECCCHSYLASLWKYMASSASKRVSNLTAIIQVIMACYIIRHLVL